MNFLPTVAMMVMMMDGKLKKNDKYILCIFRAADTVQYAFFIVGN